MEVHYYDHMINEIVSHVYIVDGKYLTEKVTGILINHRQFRFKQFEA